MADVYCCRHFAWIVPFPKFELSILIFLCFTTKRASGLPKIEMAKEWKTKPKKGMKEIWNRVLLFNETKHAENACKLIPIPQAFAFMVWDNIFQTYKSCIRITYQDGYLRKIANRKPSRSRSTAAQMIIQTTCVHMGSLRVSSFVYSFSFAFHSCLFVHAFLFQSPIEEQKDKWKALYGINKCF